MSPFAPRKCASLTHFCRAKGDNEAQNRNHDKNTTRPPLIGNGNLCNFGDGVGAVYGIALGDLNNDPYPDFVVARSEAPNTVYFSSK